MEKVGLFTSLAWRNLWRNQRRTLITFLAITVGVWSMIVLAAIMDAWAMSAFHASVNNLTGHGQIHSKHYLDDPGVDHCLAPLSPGLVEMLDSAQVKRWARRVRVSAIVQSERENAPVTLVGIEPQRERGLSFIADAVNAGHYPENNQAAGVLLGKKLAKRLRTRLGKRVVLLSQAQDGSVAEQGFRVIGIYESDHKEIESHFVFVSISQAQKMLGIDNDLSEVAFRVEDLQTLPDVLARLKKLQPQLDIKSWDELEPFSKAIIDISTGTIAMWTVTMFILVAFGLINTLLMAVFERTREFGLFQALGMRPKFILLQVLIESIMLIGLGVLAGMITGVLTILIFHDGLDLGVLAEGAAAFGAGRVLYPQVDWMQGSLIALFVWLMGIIVSIYPAWHAAREVPVEAINKSY